jgi:hypothetical protein
MLQPTTNNPPASHTPVAVALRSVLVLGIACTVFGLFFVITFGVLNALHRFRPFFGALGTVAWLAPGISYLWCVYLMRRHRSGAATIALVTAILQAIVAAALLVASMTFDPVTPLPIVFCVLWLMALSDCMRHLVRARRFIASATERARGFEIEVAPRPVVPISDSTVTK